MKEKKIEKTTKKPASTKQMPTTIQTTTTEVEVTSSITQSKSFSPTNVKTFRTSEKGNDWKVTSDDGYHYFKAQNGEVMGIMTWTWYSQGLGKGTWRLLIDFAQLLDIKKGAHIVKANLVLHLVEPNVVKGAGNWGRNTMDAFSIRRVTSIWDSFVSWQSQPTVTEQNKVDVKPEQSTLTIDVSRLVQDMVNEERHQRQGLMIRLNDETQYKALFFYSEKSSQKKPILNVDYEE